MFLQLTLLIIIKKIDCIFYSFNPNVFEIITSGLCMYVCVYLLINLFYFMLGIIINS